MTDTSREAVERLIAGLDNWPPTHLHKGVLALRALLEERDILRTEAQADAEAIGALREAQSWQAGDTAPKDGSSILVFGAPEKHPRLEVLFLKPHQFTAHYDSCDDAFCIDGGDWMGPFIVPLFWKPLDADPEAKP